MSEAAPQAQYFLLTSPMGRGQESAEKKKCTWHREYFKHYTDKDGALLLCSVNECEDKTMWFSDPMPFTVPQRAEPSTAAVYNGALARYKVVAAKKKAEADKAKQQKKQLAEMRAALASAEHPAPAPERSEASLQLPAVVVPGLVAEPVKVEGLPAKIAAQPAEVPLPQPSAPATGLLDDFTVLDLEFQGKFMLEMCAIRFKNWEQVGEPLVSFVRFTDPVWRAISELTGITNLHLADAPSEKDVLRKFFGLAGDSVLVCHSVGADRTVLEAARARQGKETPLPNKWLCTLALARRRAKAGLLPNALKFGLGELCQHFKIKTRGAHRAKADVLMCYQLLRHLHEQQPITKLDFYGAVQPGKSRKASTPAGPGRLFEAAA